MKIIEIGIDDLIETIINEPETWAQIAFSMACSIIREKDKDATDEQIDEWAVAALYDLSFQYIANPKQALLINKRFKEASDKFFKEEGIKE